MSFFVQATEAGRPKSPLIRTIGVIVAGFFVLFATAQLFTYERFPSVVAELDLPGSDIVSSLYVSLIVTLEVAAVPFLLGMRLSVAMRIVSMIAGWIALLGLMFVSIWENVMNTTVNSSILGATLQPPLGWWTTCLLLAVGVLHIWVAWGRWPKVSTQTPVRVDA